MIGLFSGQAKRPKQVTNKVGLFDGRARRWAWAESPLPPFRTVALAQQPRHFWPLGETSGTYGDSGFDPRPLTVNGSPTRGVPGLVVGDDSLAIDFEASAGNQHAINSSSQTLSTVFSISALVKPESFSLGWPILAWKRDSDGEQVRRFYIESTANKLSLNTVGTNPVDWKTSVDYTFTAGQTYHVACTMDASQVARFYVNGLPITAGFTTGGTQQTPGTTANHVYIAWDWIGFALARADGVMGMVGAWDRVLPPEEISAQAAAAGLPET